MFIVYDHLQNNSFNVFPKLTGFSQDITDGVNKSAKAVKAAEAGIRQIGTLAQQQTLCKFLSFSHWY